MIKNYSFALNRITHFYMEIIYNSFTDDTINYPKSRAHVHTNSCKRALYFSMSMYLEACADWHADVG